MKFGLEHLGAKVTYAGFSGKRDGYFLIEGFLKSSDGSLFIEGKGFGGMETGSKPYGHRLDKDYFMVTGFEENFSLYAYVPSFGTTDSIDRIMSDIDFGPFKSEVRAYTKNLVMEINRALGEIK